MLAIITCFEATIEDKCIGLYRSLARHASYPSGFCVFGVCPRAGMAPSAHAIDTAARMGVEYIEAPINTEFADYPLANKPLACWHVASKIRSADAYLFLDSDTLFLRKTDLGIHAGADISMRPVDVKNIGIASFDEVNGGYWKGMYDFLGVASERRVTPSIGEDSILEYYNSGYVFLKDATIFETWLRLMTHLLREGRRPDSGVFFVEQSALSASITASEKRVDILPNDINYPLHLHAGLPLRTKIDDLSSTRHIHYHALYEDRATRHSAVLATGFGAKSEEISELLHWAGLMQTRRGA